MHHSLDKIHSKLTDYKLCGRCGNLNWYENEKCIWCDTTEFNNDQDLVKEFVENEMKFYKTEYPEGGYKTVKIAV